VLVVVLSALVAGLPLADAKEGENLLALLPQAGEVQGWQPEGSPQQAVGEELFSLINGGAEIFLSAGFSQAMSQTYVRADQQLIQVEIYEMTDPEAARVVFARKTQGDGEPVALGTQGVVGAYYVIFWQDRFLVAVTGPDATPDTRTDLLVFCRAIGTRINQRHGG
jgi:hypothetical protein